MPPKSRTVFPVAPHHSVSSFSGPVGGSSCDRAIAVLEESLEPVVHSQPHGIRERVRQRRFERSEVACRAQRRVGARELRELLTAAGFVRRRIGPEEIVRADRDQQRLGRYRPQQVPPVEGERTGPNQILFGIVGRARREKRVGREILRIAGAHGCRGQAIVHRRQNHRQRAAARLAGGSQPARIHLRVRREHVQAAHGVPQLCARGGLAHQQHLASGDGVLLGRRSQAREPSIRLGVIGAFALADRVEGENHVTQLNQSLAAPLVERVALAVSAVAHLEEDAGIGRRAALRQIKIGGDEKARAALVDNLFHAVPGTLKAAGGAQIERRPLRQRARELLECAARPCLVVADRRRRVERRDARVAPGIGAGRDAGKVVRQAARVFPITDGADRCLRAHRRCCKGAGRSQQPAARQSCRSIGDSDCHSMTPTRTLSSATPSAAPSSDRFRWLAVPGHSPPSQSRPRFPATPPPR